MYSNVKDLCKPTNKDRFTPVAILRFLFATTDAGPLLSCNGSKVVYNASMIWGVVGPKRLFQSGQVYSSLMYFFIIGVSGNPSELKGKADHPSARGDLRRLCALPTIPKELDSLRECANLLQRRRKHTSLRKSQLLTKRSRVNPCPISQNTTQYSLWFIVGFFFNYLIRKKAFAWWKRYNYFTQAALDTGVALATIMMFFALSYNGIKLVWGGNTIGNDTFDSKSVPYLKSAKGSYFGKGPGEI